MQHADLIMKSGAVFTGLGDHPFRGGVAIKENRIIAVGSDSEINSFIGAHTAVYQYKNQLIMPGFVDAHVHFFLGALAASEYMNTEISESSSEEECIDMMVEYANAHPDVPRICGMGWFPANWNDAPLPAKESLDRAFPDKPVYLLCADAHTAWLNSKALKECGITGGTPVECGEICKDANGEPTGILKEMAGFLTFGKMLSLPKEEIKRIQKNFLKEIAKNGITCISDMTAYALNKETAALYLAGKELEQENSLTARLHFYPALGTAPDYEPVLRFKSEFDTKIVKISGLKQFVDGVTSTYTGFLLEPYEDNRTITGSPLYPRQVYDRCVIEANRVGLGVRLHCIADGSVRLALDVFESANLANNNEGNRKQIKNCIEHCENIHPDDLPRFAGLGVIASTQPYHLTLDYNEKISRMGSERCRYEWPHRSLLDAGAKLAFGTDYPVVGFNPFPTIYAAVTRCDDSGNPTGANPRERIALSEALKAYTCGSARAYGRENELGTLEAGKLADIVVINRNLFAIPEADIKDCFVEMTVMDGKIVYEKEKIK